VYVCICAAAEAEVRGEGGRERGDRATRLGRWREERLTRGDAGGWAFGVHAGKAATTWTLGDGREGLAIRYVPPSVVCSAQDTGACSHVRCPGPVEWIVDMWECFVILSWWEEGICGILVYGQLTGFGR
jgi:hypothetical protein